MKKKLKKKRKAEEKSNRLVGDKKTKKEDLNEDLIEGIPAPSPLRRRTSSKIVKKE